MKPTLSPILGTLGGGGASGTGGGLGASTTASALSSVTAGTGAAPPTRGAGAVPMATEAAGASVGRESAAGIGWADVGRGSLASVAGGETTITGSGADGVGRGGATGFPPNCSSRNSAVILSSELEGTLAVVMPSSLALT